MDCQSCQNNFSQYLDHDLDLDLTSQLSSHLASCPDCAEEWRMFQKTVQLLQHIPLESAPADFLVGVQQKLHPEGFLSKLQKFFTISPGRLATSSGLALVMVGLISTAIFKGGIQTEHSPTNNQIAGTSSKTALQQTNVIAANAPAPVDYYPGVPQLPSYDNQGIFRPSSLITRLKQQNSPPISYVSTGSGSGMRQEPISHGPDLHITLQAKTRSEQMERIHQLIHASTGKVRALNNSNVLMTIPSTGIRQLQQLCGSHDAVCHSYSGHNNHYVPPKRHITVAVQWQ